jgi:hypothetical protein
MRGFFFGHHTLLGGSAAWPLSARAGGSDPCGRLLSSGSNTFLDRIRSFVVGQLPPEATIINSAGQLDATSLATGRISYTGQSEGVRGEPRKSSDALSKGSDSRLILDYQNCCQGSLHNERHTPANACSTMANTQPMCLLPQRRRLDTSSNTHQVPRQSSIRSTRPRPGRAENRRWPQSGDDRR